MIQRAAIHVQSSGRSVVTGANVLIAMFTERDNRTFQILSDHDITRYDAVNFVSYAVARDASWEEKWPSVLTNLKFIGMGAPDTAGRDQKRASLRKAEQKKISGTIETNGEGLSLLARSLELQITLEVERLQATKPNFRSEDEAKAFGDQIDFLTGLSASLGALAQGIATIAEAQGVGGKDDPDTVAENLQDLRDATLSFLSENRGSVGLICVRIPAMLGSIALFSSAGASMVSATPILMALFGGDKIVQLIRSVKH